MRIPFWFKRPEERLAGRLAAFRRFQDERRWRETLEWLYPQRRTTIGLSLPDGYRIPAPEAPEGAYVLGLNPRWLNTPLATSTAGTDRPSRRVLAWSMGGTFAPWAQG